MSAKNTGTEYYRGFDLISVCDVPDCNSKCVYLRHRKTGLEVLHLLNDDPENLFAFAFRTPVRNSSGAAHITEHSVFCGSEKFPLREPFTNLMNQSVSTFLNALTYPDRTVYPASSLIRSDYFNLMDVYGDAVFFPLLKKEAFLQEGHRLEAGGNGAVSIQGVVYNEMKGSYSSFDSVAADVQIRSLFPGTVYEYDSGGDPLVIPDFSYGDFRAFHKKYYRPDNCLVFLYGNIPTEEQLAYLQDRVLSRLEARIPPDGVSPDRASPDRAGGSDSGAERPAAAVSASAGGGAERQGGGAESGRTLQTAAADFLALETAAPFGRPRRVSAKAPVSGATGASVTVGWRCGDTENLQDYIECAFLTEVLSGHDGSPLTKALLESGLGDDTASVSGISNESARSFIVSFGLSGVRRRDEKKVYALIFSVLEKLCEEGVPQGDIDAALMSAEFANREIVRAGGGPYSLVLLDRALCGWSYGGNPAAMLFYRAAFDRIRRNLETAGYTESLIRKYLLENRNCSFTAVFPSRSYLAGRRRQEARAVRRLSASADRETLRAETAALHEYQTRREGPEETACIPRLRLSDLNVGVECVRTDVSLCGGSVPLFLNRENTNGIAYIDVCFPVDTLPAAEYPYLPLYSYCALNTGWNGKSWSDCAGETAVRTGGMYARLFTSDSAGTANPASLCGLPQDSGIFGRDWICFSMKTVSENLEVALNLFAEAISAMEFTDLKRIKTLAAEAKSAVSSGVIPRGNRYAALRTKCSLSRAQAAEEIWRGLSQVFTMSRIAGEAPEQLARHFQALTERILSGGAVIHAAADGRTADGLAPLLERFAQSARLRAPAGKLSQSDGDFFDLVRIPPEDTRVPAAEMFTAASQTGFSAVTLPASPFGTRENAGELVLAHWLSGSLLWEKIRTAGGAYGAYAAADGLSGAFSFSTFRDPSPVRSTDAFLECLRKAAGTELSPDECERLITGTYGDEIQPRSPAGRAGAAFFRLLYGISDDDRRRRAGCLLEVTPAAVRAAADRLLARASEKRSAVICDKSPENAGIIIELPL